MIHPSSRIVHVSDLIGDGVIATEFLPRGTIVWTQDALDQVLDSERVARLPSAARSVLERYAHIDEQGRHVLCWDAGKLINHNCEPTLRGIGTWFQVARRDIQPGEELTCDYAECNITDELPCACRSPHCRGAVHARDLLEFADQWDAEAEALLDDVRRVPQPLWPHLLIPEQADALVRRYRPLPSFRDLYAGNE